MANYYRDKNIYENVVLKCLSCRDDKILLYRINQKAKTTFENFVNYNKIGFNLKKIKTPPCIGLKDINSYCSMNSILQCFSHITKLVEFFRNDNQVLEVIERNKNNNHLILSSSFKYLIDNLWPLERDFTKNKRIFNNGTNKYFCPYNIKEKINKMNDFLNYKNFSTSKDLIIFIILTLHEELNNNTLVNLETNNQIDELNENIMRSNLIDTFKRENNSIISDLFYAMKEITLCCNNCKIKKYNFKKYFYLDFNLNSIWKFKTKSQNSTNNSTFDNIITIYDCFKYDIKERNVSAELYCNFCKRLAPFSYNINLGFAPKILIIFINRIEGINTKIKFEFYEHLNIGKYIQIKNFGFCYKLIGVVATQDKYIMDKHFFAFCKSPVNSKWYKYDDNKVSQITDTNQEILNNNVPYILFYQKAIKEY